LLAQAFDLDKLELSGEPFTVAEQLAVFPSFGAFGFSGAAFSVSPTGVLAWGQNAHQGTTSLTWFDRSGAKLGTVGEPADYSNPALSPDDRKLAVARRDPATKTRDIWIFDLARGGRTRLTFDPADDLGATWSPDGTRIAFTSDRRGGREIYQKPTNGSQDEELLLESKDRAANAESWSPDGRMLVFNWEGEGVDLYFLPLFSEHDRKPVPFLATEFREHMGIFSPDGKWLAYACDESGRSEVYVRRVSEQGAPTGGKWQISTDGGVEPRWRGDGKEIVYSSGTGEAGPAKLMSVDVKTDGASFEAGVSRPLFEVRLPDIRRNRYVMSGDGRRFLVNLADTPVDESTQRVQVLVNWLPTSGSARRR
jgi:eukaryotic-like serine/threonine-protein kinase